MPGQQATQAQLQALPYVLEGILLFALVDNPLI
jgi:hypothetical protein